MNEDANTKHYVAKDFFHILLNIIGIVKTISFVNCLYMKYIFNKIGRFFHIVQVPKGGDYHTFGIFKVLFHVKGEN